MASGGLARDDGSDGAARQTAATILLVDDDPALLEITALGLTDLGFTVLTARRAVDAFALAEQVPGIDLIVTDIVMPGLDGLMLADMVKQRRPELRFLYVTGYPERAERQPGYRYGPTLRRPFRLAELSATVRRLLAEPPDLHGFRPPLAPAPTRAPDRAR